MENAQKARRDQGSEADQTTVTLIQGTADCTEDLCSSPQQKESAQPLGCVCEQHEEASVERLGLVMTCSPPARPRLSCFKRRWFPGATDPRYSWSVSLKIEPSMTFFSELYSILID
jgi:hypothetical protein